MIKAVIFDFDGVLVESVDIKTGAFAKLFEKEGKDVVKKVVDYHLKNAGVSRFEKLEYIYKNILGRPLPKSEFEDLCQKFARLVTNEVVAAPYVKGAREFLRRSYSRYACFISSATPQLEIEEIVRRREMERYFKGVYGSPKAKKDIVKDIMMMNGLAGHESVYVGDALSDYGAAKANGVIFIARVTGPESVLHTIGALKVKDLCGLDTMLDRMAISEEN